jgi:hypothetical protein
MTGDEASPGLLPWLGRRVESSFRLMGFVALSSAWCLATTNFHGLDVHSGQSALVTGSTFGIDLGITRRLAASGAKLVLNGFGGADRDEPGHPQSRLCPTRLVSDFQQTKRPSRVTL